MGTLLLSGLLVGFLLGILTLTVFTEVKQLRVMRRIKQEIEKAFNEGFKMGTVAPKLERVNAIAGEQMNYMSGLDRPSASAAHSKHKNSVISTIKKLEQEKLELLRAIIKDGVDPILSVSIDGKQQNIKTSELITLMEGYQANNDGVPPPPKTDSKSPRGGKILQLVNNNEEKSNVPSNPTVPGT